jgi:ribose 5-phosphate isomerase B
LKIAIGSDHAGFPLKASVAEWLAGQGHDILDLGTTGTDSVDYPGFAKSVCHAVLSGRADRGILVCNSGIGMSISANRNRGIRAALCLFPTMAHFARRHNDANVLVLAGGLTAGFLAIETVKVFLAESFDGGRHERRIRLIDEGGDGGQAGG